MRPTIRVALVWLVAIVLGLLPGLSKALAASRHAAVMSNIGRMAIATGIVHGSPMKPMIGTAQLPLTFFLKPAHINALRRLANAISNPHSVHYRRFLTPAQIDTRFAPSVAEVNQVRKLLRAEGLTITHESFNRMAITATASASKVNSFFGTTMGWFHKPGHKSAFYANESTAYLPAALVPYISQVYGLNSQEVLPLSTPASSTTGMAPPPTATTDSKFSLDTAPSVAVGQKLVVDVQLNDPQTGLPISNAQITNVVTLSGPGSAIRLGPTGPNVIGGSGIDSVTSSSGQAQVYVRFNAPGSYSVALVASVGGTPYQSSPIQVSVTGTESLINGGYPGYTPTEINQAYHAQSVIDQGGGAGITVGVIVAEVATQTANPLSANWTWSSDLSTYFSNMGLSNNQPTVVPVSDGTGWVYSTGWTQEGESDVERVVSAAPKASVIVYDANNTANLFLAVNAAIQQDAVNIVSISWGGVSSPQGIFSMGTAEGITFFAASGDTGPYASSYDSVVSQYPANSAYVTGVGGTEMAIGANGTAASEWAWSPQWNWNGTGLPGSSGGGYTPSVLEPQWQQNVQSSGMRGTPDVSLMSSYGWYNSFITGSSMLAGGTSEASPTWAGYLADIEAANRIIDFGNLNPELYFLSRDGTYDPFHAIQHGSTAWVTPWNSQAPGYAAGGLWNPATGLGTPNVALLSQDLNVPLPTALSANSAAPGQLITITGTNFGSGPNGGYLQLIDNGTSWGAPGNAASFQIDQWSNSHITFTVPTASGPNNEWAVAPGSTAQIAVFAPDGLVAGSLPLNIMGVPSVSAVSMTAASAGQEVTLSGSNFGATQGTSYVAFHDNGVNWGAPGNGASFQIDQWSNSQITFTVPTASGPNNAWAVTPGTIATIQVVTGGVNFSSGVALHILAPGPVVSGLTPGSAAAGQQVTLTGNNFGATQGTSYVAFHDNGVNWGAPGNGASFQIDQWSNSQITFTVPTASGPNNAWAVTPGTTAELDVVAAGGTTSNGSTLAILYPPQISTVSPTAASAGQEVTLSGSNFGATQGTSYVAFHDNGVNWGAPGNGASFQIDQWSNSQITFTVPTASGPNNAWAVTPGTTATIQVVTGGVNFSSGVALHILGPGPVVNGLTPGSAAAGQQVTLTGNNFGATQGTSYVAFHDNGVNWGAPGNAAGFQINQWSNSQITFTVPTASGPNNAWAVTPWTTATVFVTTSAGASMENKLAIAGPVINSLTPSPANQGMVVTILGQDFGAVEGPGYVHFTDNGVSWGAPGNSAIFVVDSWSNDQITFTIPYASGPGGAWTIAPETTAHVSVVTGAGSQSNMQGLPLN